MHSQQLHRKSFIFISLLLCTWNSLAQDANVNIISKAGWNGEESKAELTKADLPVGRVVVTHTAGSDCNNMDACVQQVRNIQHYQMYSFGFDDICYNFLIGNDGNVYEGRGWDNVGAFAKGYNIGSLGVAFIGMYETNLPSEKALAAAKALLLKGVQLGKLKEDYKLFGHRQLSPTSSPGAALYTAIKEWPHWTRSLN